MWPNKDLKYEASTHLGVVFRKNLIRVQRVGTWFRVPSWVLGVSTLMDMVKKNTPYEIICMSSCHILKDG